MNILCMEDDKGLTYLLKKALEEHDYQVTFAGDGKEGLNLLSENQFDVALVDYEMPSMNGLEVLKHSQHLKNKTPIIMVTGQGNEHIAVQAMQMGAIDYVVKDAGLGYLKMLPAVVKQAIDDSNLKKAHEEAKLKLQLEEERAKILAQFIQDASHEFRTPLAIINTSNHILSQLINDEKVTKYLNRVNSQVRHMNDLVNALITLTRLTNTKSLQFDRYFVKSLIEEVVIHNQSICESKNIHLQYGEIDELLAIYCAPLDIGMALTEVVDNACRYSHDNGTVIIRAYKDGEAVVIEVQDFGIGIQKDDLPKIFDRFFRKDSAHTTRGFGLGLSIALRVVELHHGEITIESKPDEGTLIRLTLTSGIQSETAPLIC